MNNARKNVIIFFTRMLHIFNMILVCFSSTGFGGSGLKSFNSILEGLLSGPTD